MAVDTGLIPVNVLTGFLGSGKTTVLRHLLESPAFGDTAVLINEFGEVGLDHLLLRTLDAAMVLLQSGCICCTIRGDLSEAIRALFSQRERGTIPRFRRLVIETTGLADPTPILATILADPVIRHHFRLGNVIATVDAVQGEHTLETQPESLKQAAVADRLLLTKTDLASPAQVARLRRLLSDLNPSAVVRETVQGNVDSDLVLSQDIHNPATKTAEVRAWLTEAASRTDHTHHPDRTRHGDIRSYHIRLERPVEWAAFGLWLSLLVNRHGDKLLRVKGILDIEGSGTPVVVNGVQHLIHAPEHLPEWPTPDRGSRLIVIARGLDGALVERSLRTFLRLGESVRSGG